MEITLTSSSYNYTQLILNYIYMQLHVTQFKKEKTVTIPPRRMYWWRASIQDGQAYVLKHLVTPLFWNGFSIMLSVIFRRRSKRIAFLESVNYSTCVYMQISNFRGQWPLLAPFRSLYLPNAWPDSPDYQKAHLQNLGFPSVPLVWGKTVSCRLCAGQSNGTLKTRKMLFLDLVPPTL